MPFKTDAEMKIEYGEKRGGASDERSAAELRNQTKARADVISYVLSLCSSGFSSPLAKTSAISERSARLMALPSVGKTHDPVSSAFPKKGGRNSM